MDEVLEPVDKVEVIGGCRRGVCRLWVEVRGEERGVVSTLGRGLLIFKFGKGRDPTSVDGVITILHNGHLLS